MSDAFDIVVTPLYPPVNINTQNGYQYAVFKIYHTYHRYIHRNVYVKVKVFEVKGARTISVTTAS